MSTIKHTAGDTFRFVVTVTDPENDNAVVPITGWSFEATGRPPRVDAATPIITFTCTIEDAPNGLFSINASAAETSLWVNNIEYTVRIRMTKDDGFVVTSPSFIMKTEEAH